MVDLATRTVRSTADLKDVVAAYSQFGEFSFDIETKANRKVRSLTLVTLVPSAKGTVKHSHCTWW